MKAIHAAPSRVFGKCPAGHAVGDELIIDGTVVRSVRGPICYVAMSAFTDQVTQIGRGERATNHLSCPGCGFDSDPENRVVYVLGSEEAWSLSKKYSRYNWGRLDGKATEASKRYCDECWELTQAGRYAEAERVIDIAIEHLKPAEDEEPRSRKDRVMQPGEGDF